MLANDIAVERYMSASFYAEQGAASYISVVFLLI